MAVYHYKDNQIVIPVIIIASDIAFLMEQISIVSGTWNAAIEQTLSLRKEHLKFSTGTIEYFSYMNMSVFK